jgi:hypothetical protein
MGVANSEHPSQAGRRAGVPVAVTPLNSFCGETALRDPALVDELMKKPESAQWERKRDRFTNPLRFSKEARLNERFFF